MFTTTAAGGVRCIYTAMPPIVQCGSVTEDPGCGCRGEGCPAEMRVSIPESLDHSDPPPFLSLDLGLD